MILTPTSIDERPAKLTRAYAVKSSPTWIGSLKSTLSTDTVTHGFEASRIAPTAATRSTSASTKPPNTFPRTLACCGTISADQVGRGRFPEDHLGNAHVARQGAHLRLEQVTQRVHGRRVVGVPGEVAEQPLRLVAGPDR